eukprot:1158501-Pelagomonas_calceolata.AAC.3
MGPSSCAAQPCNFGDKQSKTMKALRVEYGASNAALSLGGRGKNNQQCDLFSIPVALLHGALIMGAVQPWHSWGKRPKSYKFRLVLGPEKQKTVSAIALASQQQIIASASQAAPHCHLDLKQNTCHQYQEVPIGGRKEPHHNERRSVPASGKACKQGSGAALDAWTRWPGIT